MRYYALRRSWPMVAAAALGMVIAACSDRGVVEVTPTPEPALRRDITCTARVTEQTVTCAASAPGGGASYALIGGQNVLVRMNSSNVSYNAGTELFTFDASVTNLLGTASSPSYAKQELGNLNGVADSIKVFFVTNPTATGGSGVITVNGAGSGVFTGSGQPYYSYAGRLAVDSTSANRNWSFSVPPTVTSFSFTVAVAASLSPALVISEIMPNPAVVADADGEWIEVYNAGIDPVDLNGYRLGSRAGSGQEAHTIAGSVIIPRGGYALLGVNNDSVFNGGVRVAYKWTGITLTNTTSATTPDYIAIRYPLAAGTLPAVDSVIYAIGGATTAPPNGRSRELLDLKSDNTVMMGSAWNTAYDEFGYGDGNGGFDRGSPNAANDPAVPVGPVAVVRISPAFHAIDSLGQARTFSAVGEDTLGQPAATTFTWQSLNTAVATINASGQVTHVGQGHTTIVATSANGVADSVLYSVFKYSPAAVYRTHTAFGIPSGPADSTNLILTKPQYVVSYNAARGGPNWVSWNLNRTHFAGVPRCDCFSPDPALDSAGVYHVVTGDYTGSGYSRGHMVQSEQRTQTAGDNAATFLMTNILPQLQDLNGGPWQDFEDYTNLITRFDSMEVYNIAGGIYAATPPTLGAGRVDIPSHTWKIIVVMNFGEGLADVATAADIQVIVVKMPNILGIQSQPWEAYITTVDQIEAETGFDFLAALPDAIEAAVEATAHTP